MKTRDDRRLDRIERVIGAQQGNISWFAWPDLTSTEQAKRIAFAMAIGQLPDATEAAQELAKDIGELIGLHALLEELEGGPPGNYGAELLVRIAKVFDLGQLDIAPVATATN